MTKKHHLESDSIEEKAKLKDRIAALEKKLLSYEEAISEQERKYSNYNHVLDHIPLAILSLDVFGYIQVFNSSFSKLFDYPENKQGQHIHISRFLQFKDTALGGKISRLLDDHLQFDIETRIPGLDSPDSFFRVRGISMSNEQGKAIAHIIIIGNVTKRRMAEQNLILAKEKAEEANMLKTAFLSNLSHEIRTPLNHILGFLELLLMEGIQHEERQEYTSIVRGSSEILLKRIEDVIYISKLETRQMDVVNDNIAVSNILNQVLAEAKNLQNQQNKSNVQVHLNKHIDHRNLIISADIRKVHQILINFLENALVFTHEGRIELGYFIENKNGICFYVKDTGVGISPEFHESIFEHFRQVDNSPTREIGGSGLGLAIARGMASLMNGTITLDSILGQGSTFYLHLPESIISIEPLIDDTYNSDSNFKWLGKKILIADYELASFNLLKLMLTKTKADLFWIKTGDELISELYNNTPDVIIIDVDLPGMPIKKLIKTLKQKYKTIPLVIMGQENDKDEIQLLVKTIADHLLLKPIVKQNLLNLLNHFISPSEG